MPPLPNRNRNRDVDEYKKDMEMQSLEVTNE
jgi:hypothetical protein